MAKQALFIANGIVGDLPGLTGGEMRFIEIAKGWQKLGWEINLLSAQGGKALCDKLGLSVVFHQSSKVRSIGRGTFIRRLFESAILPKTLKDFNQGIVYCSSEQLYDVLPGIILKLRRPRSIKLAVVVHWLPPILWWQRCQSTFINSFFFLIFERMGLLLACIFADKLLPVSHSTLVQIERSLFGRFFINKVQAVDCGVPFQEIVKFAKEVKTKEYEAVFMKRIQAVKGIFDVIDVWAEVIKERPGARIIIIGSGIDEAEAKRRVLERHLERNVIFLGVIYDLGEKIKLLAKSKLFILPTYEENWAIVIGEALAAGVPVLTYDLKELNEVWRDKVTWVPVGDKNKLLGVILNYLEDEELMRRISTEGQSYMVDFDWEKISRKELSIINGSAADSL